MKLILQNGSIYEGEVHNNLPHGFGIISNDYGIIYSGMFHLGKYHGEGKLFLYNYGSASYKMGNFSNGTIIGEARFYNILDQLVGIESTDSNGILTERNIYYDRHDGMKRYAKNAFFYAEDGSLICIQCQCGSFNTVNRMDHKGYFTTNTYAVDCNECGRHSGYVKENTWMK